MTVPLGEVALAAWDRMRARAAGRESCLPVPWPELAETLDRYAADGRALRPGVHVLVGGTGSGKTQLALDLTLAAARGGHPAFYVGLELDPVSVTARLAALAWAELQRTRPALSSVPWSVLDWPRTDTGRDALDRVAEAVSAELERLPIRLAFGDARGGDNGFTVARLGEVFDEAHAAGTPERPALVVVDFLQLLAAEPGVADDREIRTRIARASYAASNAARDGRVAVLLVSATSRENYGSMTQKPEGLTHPASMVGTGKESGEIEYAATSVLVLAGVAGRPETKLLAVAKNRHGGTGWIALDWNGTRFAPAPGRLEQLKQNAADMARATNPNAPRRVPAQRRGEEPYGD